MTLEKIKLRFFLAGWATAHLWLAMPSQAFASTGHDANDYGLQTGVLLSKGLKGVDESIPGWGFRASTPAGRGILELSTFLGRGNGLMYSNVELDFRFDFDLYENAEVLFLVGGHVDYYTPLGRSSATGTGFQYGGAILQPLTGALSARADFRSRYGPGTGLEVTVGLSYRTAGSSSQ